MTTAVIPIYYFKKIFFTSPLRYCRIPKYSAVLDFSRQDDSESPELGTKNFS